MRIQSVKMTNFKSIGTDFSEIIIEPNITAIIGKNESGKSNVLDGLSRIRFLNNMNSAFHSDNLNRASSDPSAKIEYRIILKPFPEETAKYGEIPDTEIHITSNHFAASGGIISLYQTYVKDAIGTMLNILTEGLRSISSSSREQFNTYIIQLKKEDNLNIPIMHDGLAFINSHISSLPSEQQKAVRDSIDLALSQWNELISLFPRIFFRNTNKVLKHRYTYDEVKKELESPSSFPDSLLANFVKLLKVNKDDFLNAVESGVTGRQESLRTKIQRSVDQYINTPFAAFYDAESVTFSVRFNSNSVYFSVYSGEGESLLLSERSNGLKWYLNTFIDAQANDLPSTNMVYLFDEPGTSLHVNAQKELLKLFKSLSDKGNQIVYTTHSPYMLDLAENGIHRIRAVVKNQEGITSIFKTAYDYRIAPEFQKDTLAPLVNALGMNLSDTFGPAKDKINIVTEGMSDYIFLTTMAKQLGLNSGSYAIIPSVGASNCVNICSILQGWGCPFIAVFDYDKEGVESGGDILQKKMLFEYQKHFCYIADISQSEIEAKTYKENSYMVEDLISREEIERYRTENNAGDVNKTLMAKLMCDAIEAGTFTLKDCAIDRIKAFFARILSYSSIE